MFRGSSQTRVDEKGRLKVPADYKRLVEDAGKEFYITSTDGKRAQIYPMEVWKEKEDALGKIASSTPARQRFLQMTSYFGQVVEVDQQGRLLLPQVLRESAQLSGDVVVLGQMRILEVVNLDSLKKQMELNPLTEADLAELAEMGV